MKITITDSHPTPSGLRLGLRVEHEKAGWIRFATTVLVVDRLSFESRQAVVQALNEARDDWLDSEQEVLF